LGATKLTVPGPALEQKITVLRAEIRESDSIPLRFDSRAAEAGRVFFGNVKDETF
jgi:hypothetical protein